MSSGTHIHRLDTTSQTSLGWSVQAARCLHTWSTPNVIIVLGANWYMIVVLENSKFSETINTAYSKVWKTVHFSAHHGKQYGTVQGHKRSFHMM